MKAVQCSESTAKQALLAAEASKADRRLVWIDNEMEELREELHQVQSKIKALTKDREQVIKGRAAVVRLLTESYAAPESGEAKGAMEGRREALEEVVESR